MFTLIKCSYVLLSGLKKRLLAIAIAAKRLLAMPADEHDEVVHDNLCSTEIFQFAVGQFRKCYNTFESSPRTLRWRQDFTWTSQQMDKLRWGYDVGCLDAQDVLMARVEDVIKEVQKRSRALVISEFEDAARQNTLIATIDQRIDKEEAPIGKLWKIVLHVIIVLSIVIYKLYYNRTTTA